MDVFAKLSCVGDVVSVMMYGSCFQTFQTYPPPSTVLGLTGTLVVIIFISDKRLSWLRGIQQKAESGSLEFWHPHYPGTSFYGWTSFYGCSIG
jgi:hypothetical protein